jgi:hypothetical protein
MEEHSPKKPLNKSHKTSLGSPTLLLRSLTKQKPSLKIRTIATHTLCHIKLAKTPSCNWSVDNRLGHQLPVAVIQSSWQIDLGCIK